MFQFIEMAIRFLVSMLKFNKENIMSDTVKLIEDALEQWRAEDAKFVSGNNAAGTRARKALAEVAKAVKIRRNEITAEKNARAEAKKAA